MKFSKLFTAGIASLLMLATPVFFTGCPDPDAEDDPEFMTLTLDYSGLTAKDDVKKITVTYGYGEDNGAGVKHYKEDATDVVAEIGEDYTATIECNKEYANEYGWFNATVVKLFNEANEEIPCELSANYFEYNEDGVTLNIVNVVESATFTVNLDFTLDEGVTVKMTYGADSNTQEVTGTVSATRTSVSFELDGAYKNGNGYFEVVSLVFSDNTEVTLKGDGDGWYKFETQNAEYNKKVPDTATYTDLDAVNFADAAKDSWINVSAIKDIENVSKIKIIVSDVTGFTWMCYGSAWVSEEDVGGWIGNLTVDSDGNFAATVTDAAKIAKIVNAGLIVYGGEDNGSGTVNVSYATSE